MRPAEAQAAAPWDRAVQRVSRDSRKKVAQGANHQGGDGQPGRNQVRLRDVLSREEERRAPRCRGGWPRRGRWPPQRESQEQQRGVQGVQLAPCRASHPVCSKPGTPCFHHVLQPSILCRPWGAGEKNASLAEGPGRRSQFRRESRSSTSWNQPGRGHSSSTSCPVEGWVNRSRRACRHWPARPGTGFLLP